MISCTFEHGNEALLRHVVVDALLMKDGQILLIKRADSLLEGGKWALPGGFLDRDETTIDATKREVMEESGYEVTDITLFRIIDNPDRPHEDRQNVAFIYICQAGEKNGKHDWEVSAQKWFDLNNLPEKSQIAFDHYENIELYKKYTREKHTLPIIA